MSSICNFKKAENLKSFEKLFDQAAPMLYNYAHFVLADSNAAEKAVSGIYVTAFKCTFYQNVEESFLLKLLTAEILKEDNISSDGKEKALADLNFSPLECCFVYLFLRLKLKEETVRSILDVRYEDIANLRRAVKEKISLWSNRKK